MKRATDAEYQRTGQREGEERRPGVNDETCAEEAEPDPHDDAAAEQPDNGRAEQPDENCPQREYRSVQPRQRAAHALVVPEQPDRRAEAVDEVAVAGQLAVGEQRHSVQDNASDRCSVAETCRSAEPLDHVVDAAGQCFDVLGLDRGEHRDPQLVTAEPAVRLGVDDAVRAKDGGDGSSVDAVVEIDGADYGRNADLGPGRMARRTALCRPRCTAARTNPPYGPLTRQARPDRSASPAGRRGGTAWPLTVCCRSDSCASCRSRWAGRRTWGCSAPTRQSRRRAATPLGTSRRARARHRTRSTSAGRSSRRRTDAGRQEARRPPTWRRRGRAHRRRRSARDGWAWRRPSTSRCGCRRRRPRRPRRPGGGASQGSPRLPTASPTTARPLSQRRTWRRTLQSDRCCER